MCENRGMSIEHKDGPVRYRSWIYRGEYHEELGDPSDYAGIPDSEWPTDAKEFVRWLNKIIDRWPSTHITASEYGWGDYEPALVKVGFKRKATPEEIAIHNAADAAARASKEAKIRKRDIERARATLEKYDAG